MAQFNEETLKKQIKNGEFSRVYILYGNEGYLKQHYANTICSKTVSKDFEDFNLKKLDGKETSLNEIYDCVSSFPMMSDYTCTLIKDFPLTDYIGEKGKVAVMQGAPSAPNHAERYQAHLDALAKYPDIEVVDGGIDNDNVETAKSQAAAVLAANPDLAGFLNCDAGGSGIAAAIEEAGKSGKVKFVSMDNLIEILDYIPTTIQATSSTMPQMQGEYAVLMMWQKANGVEIPAKVDTGIAYIDETNIDEWKDIVGNSKDVSASVAASTAQAVTEAEG